MEEGIDLKEDAKLALDIKSLVGIIVGIVSLAGIWFTLNEEFRIKWPRGEMGALPDDAKQDLRIEYLQKEVDYLRTVVKNLEIEQAKKDG